MNIKTLTLSLVLSLLLSACGGGSDNPAPAEQGTFTPPSQQEYAVVPSTYPVGSWQAQALQALNELRAQNALPPLVSDARLDTAATGHYEYLLLNPTAQWGHEQQPGNGFTGATVSERAANAGYVKPVREVINSFNSLATSCVWMFTQSATHLAILTDPRGKHVGIATRGCVLVIGMP